jgi:hypothetical protein
MEVAAVYAFKNGTEVINSKYPALLSEVANVINAVDASLCRTKVSKEKKMMRDVLFDSKELNKAFKKEFMNQGWQPLQVKCDYPTQYYVEGYKPTDLKNGASIEMDLIKSKLGLEVLFGKYSHMMNNVAEKMTIFSSLGHIDAGIEIVPVKSFTDIMLSNVPSFEQFVWDLEKRGVSNIDVPAMIIGIDK